MSFNSLIFKKIEFTVYKNFLLFKIGRSDYTLIDIENGKSNNCIFSDSFSYDIFPFFLSKNILIALEPYYIYSFALCEYNKIDDINYKRKKVIFEDEFRIDVRKIEKAKGFKIKDLLFYYIYTENNNYIKVFILYNEK